MARFIKTPDKKKHLVERLSDDPKKPHKGLDSEQELLAKHPKKPNPSESEVNAPVSDKKGE